MESIALNLKYGGEKTKKKSALALCKRPYFLSGFVAVKAGRAKGSKGQLNSEWIYEVIVCPKIESKNYRNFYPESLLEGRAEISVIFGFNFGTNDDLINSFWI